MNAIGRRIYGLGAVMLGLVGMATGAVSQDWLPVPAHMTGYRLLASGAGAVLIAAGLAVNLPRASRIAALVLAALFAAGMLAFELPHTVAKPADWGGWQALAESTAMALGGGLAYAQVAGRPALARGARLLLGLCLIAFGVSHFVYAKYTAALVPAWLPPSRLFWTYATGAAQVAAGLALLSGVRARLAAALLAVMYVIFGLLVHLPAVAAAPRDADAWTENAINLILVGVAWMAAELAVKTGRRSR